jgi:hypothetical protein
MYVNSSTIKNRLTTLFWKDVWPSGVNSDNFPRSFSFSIDEDVLVQDFLSVVGISDNFLLPLYPQALGELRDL